MNITSEEAFSLLEGWRNAGTPLLVHLSGRQQAIQVAIGALAGTVITIISGSENLEIDLQGAEFNGDGHPRSSNHGAYRVCEFRNGDRCSFYVPRANEIF